MKTLLSACAALSLLLAARPAHARRFALLVGDDQGDAVDERLRYAELDAQRMASVLADVGGVARSDELLVLGQDADAVGRQLEALKARLATEAKPGDQLVLYFSAHADEGDLHLSGGHLPLAVLNDFARQAPVDVVLLVIDSCHSGTVTRLKGLRPAPGTDVALEVSKVKGRVVMGSSGPDEYAQESDTLQGSYFTAHLVAALRGAADTSRDGVVSLQEAYEYAYAHTVESTFGTRGGVQHPSYHLDLRGQGDLALSRPASAPGRLRVDVAEPAELLVSNAATGSLVGEFIKAGGPALLALPPGRYDIRLRTEVTEVAHGVEIPTDGEAVLRAGDLVAIADDGQTLKGPAPSIDASAIELGGAFGTGLTRSVASATGFGLAASAKVRGLALGPLRRVQLELMGLQATATGEVPYREQTVDGRAGLLGSWTWRLLRVRAGPELGCIWVHQTRLPGNAVRDALVAEAGASARLGLQVSGPVSVFLGGFGGGAWLQSNVSKRVVLRADATAGIGVDL